jgi:hypothetical protein
MEKSSMGYENLKPTLERIRMVSGFIAGRGERTETVFELGRPD